MEYLAEYGLFFAKLVTVLVGIIIVILVLAGLRMREKSRTGAGHLEIKHWNEKIRELKQALQLHVLDKTALKNELKAQKVKAKEAAKSAKKKRKKQGSDQATADDQSSPDDEQSARVFVVNFHGDMRALAVDTLREEITAILSLAAPTDEVVVRLESGGGMVHAYGLAASQLQRVRQKGLKLTVCVDKVAASGGYMVACVADRVLAAPFAIIGSVGVVAQLPNFHRLLKKHDIDYELLTAGEYKRTLTVLGENTPKGRAKFQEDLEDVHQLFKEFIVEHRPALDIEKIATGEIWFGRHAIEKGLVDELTTSDAYLVLRCDDAQVYEVKYVEKKPLQERIGISFQTVFDNLSLKWLERLRRNPHGTGFF